jgi:hypothetical protein
MAGSPLRVALVIQASAETLQIAYVVVLVVLGYYVLPRVVIPAIARWLTRRRGGSSPEPVSRAGVALMAAMLTAFAVAGAWNRDLGRPTVGCSSHWYSACSSFYGATAVAATEAGSDKQPV